MQHYGMIIILSSPSGAGKSTLSRRLRADKGMNIGVSVSATTRQKRPSEKNGVDYHFVSEKKFKTLISQNAFLEWAQVHGAYYGTLLQEVEAVLSKGQDIIFDIDYQGALQVQKKRPQDVVSVFILPPSMAELRRRLLKRGENSEEDMQLRLHNAVEEMKHRQNYDYIVINETLQESFKALKTIIAAERLKRHRFTDSEKFINDLIAEIV